MVIRKLNLPRRTILRGLGTAIALPLLDAMVPALTPTAKAAGKPVPRMVIFGIANGVNGPDFRPRGEGTKLTELESGVILKAFDAYRDQMTVIKGLSNTEADSRDVGGGSHARAAATFLNGVRAKRTEGSDIRAGISFDQIAAKELGKDTSLLSLELGLESTFMGNCDQGYSCTYINTFSWRTPTLPLPAENNPRMVFERLFGDGGSVHARRAQMRQDRSILDWVSADIARLQRRLGSPDRLAVTEYVDAVRDVEQRIQKAEAHTLETPTPEATQPLGIPDSHDEHAKLMVDLVFLALQADITRVVTHMFSREQGNRTYPWIGVAEGHHALSHHQTDPYKIQQYTKISAYYAGIVARLVEKLRASRDGDGTLLDHSMVMYSSPFGDGDLHSPHNLPVALVGGFCGTLKGNRYLSYSMDTPFMNFGLSLLDKIGVHIDTLGDSTGRLADL
jgi:hypothetical protein